MMTATVAALGLVPFLFATGPGSEIQRPLAIVVIGGLVSSTALTLLLLPVVYAAFEGKNAIPEPTLRFVGIHSPEGVPAGSVGRPARTSTAN
jgi:cobalt-zinc-cadmium resistance protein CzcA